MRDRREVEMDMEGRLKINLLGSVLFAFRGRLAEGIG